MDNNQIRIGVENITSESNSIEKKIERLEEIRRIQEDQENCPSIDESKKLLEEATTLYSEIEKELNSVVSMVDHAREMLDSGTN